MARRAGRAAAVLGLAVGASLVLPATAASAELTPGPDRTAWFNAASGGGLAAPSPTASEDDLRIARAAGTQALATLLYSGDGISAVLEVVVRGGSAQGAPDVVACPTVGTEWEAGGNQPMDAAPEHDCSLSESFGLLSDDGTTLSFDLDGAFEVAPGTWSIALLPAPGGASAGPPPTLALPFTLDLEPPAPGSLVIEEEPGLPAPQQETSDLTGPPPAGSSTGGGFASVGELGALPADGGSAGAPALDPAVAAPETALPGAPAPVLAASPLTVVPAAVTGDDDSGRRLLALLALAGGSAAVGYAAGQQRPGPRLIGGRARFAAPALTGAAPTLPVEDRPRGIGRFAKIRDEPPRRLR